MFSDAVFEVLGGTPYVFQYTCDTGNCINEIFCVAVNLLQHQKSIPIRARNNF